MGGDFSSGLFTEYSFHMLNFHLKASHKITRLELYEFTAENKQLKYMYM